MASAARGPNSLGSQVIPGLVGPSLELRRPDQIVVRDKPVASATMLGPPRPREFHSLDRWPIDAQLLSHQRMELVIFGPHGFHSRGLIHTIIECKTHAKLQLKRSSYFLTNP